jgi:hypothetical protein
VRFDAADGGFNDEASFLLLNRPGFAGGRLM